MTAMRAHPVFADLPTTVFEATSALARQTGAINLGQGFPDDEGPLALRQRAGQALIERSNQYPPMRGLPELRQAVADHYGRHHGVALEAGNVVVTSGATEALAAALLALVRPGDEVILFEPAYDAYRPLIARAGGAARAVRLTPPLWRIDAAAIAAAVTPRTRLLLLNNPLNPAARAFDAEEMAAVAEACVRHDLVAISDEVWEHLVFDGRPHRPLIAEAGMAERTVKIGSAGKIFSMTGWKVGFACAAPDLIEPVAKAHQYLTFTTPPALQDAVAFGLGFADDWFAAMRQGFQASRDRLAAGLAEAGFAVLPSEATYFLCLDLPGSGIALDDRTFCDRLAPEFGVAAIPVSAFHDAPDAAAGQVVRLCFAKRAEVLDQAIARLGHARRVLSDASG